MGSMLAYIYIAAPWILWARFLYQIWEFNEVNSGKRLYFKKIYVSDGCKYKTNYNILVTLGNDFVCSFYLSLYIYTYICVFTSIGHYNHYNHWGTCFYFLWHDIHQKISISSHHTAPQVVWSQLRSIPVLQGESLPSARRWGVSYNQKLMSPSGKLT